MARREVQHGELGKEPNLSLENMVGVPSGYLA